MTKITLNEWRAELEKLRGDCVHRQKTCLTPEQYEIIKTARKNDIPIPWDKLAKFFKEKGALNVAGKTLKRAYDDYEKT